MWCMTMNLKCIKYDIRPKSIKFSEHIQEEIPRY